MPVNFYILNIYNCNVICKVKYSILFSAGQVKKIQCWKESLEYEQHSEKVLCDLTSLHISISDCSKMLKTGDIKCCAKLRGFRASVFQERERVHSGVQALQWGEWGALGGCDAQSARADKSVYICLHLPLLPAVLGCHHHPHAGLNSFPWHYVPCSQQGWYDAGADYLQGLNFNLSNQSPNPAHVLYVKNHTEPDAAGSVASVTWGNVAQLREL